MTARAARGLVFWYEFASTYSWLSAMRVEDLAAAAGVEIVWRPFLLGPIFAAQGLRSSPFNVYPAKGAHMWRDLERIAAARGLGPVRRPDPFPQNGLLPARLATIGAQEGWAPAFSRAVFTAEFQTGASIADPELMTRILDGMGLDAAPLLARASGDDAVKAALRGATEAAERAGIFGAPSFTTGDGELFWGDDRLEMALDWASDRAA